MMVFLFKKRSFTPELVDRRAYTSSQYERFLSSLNRFERWFGCRKAMDSAIRRLLTKEKDSSPSLLDVGCGGGDLAAHLASSFPHLTVVGSDINPDAITRANDRWYSHNLSFTKRNVFDERENSFDIVITNLVCHHLDDDLLPQFINQLCKVAKRAVIINDIHRSPLAYLLFALFTPPLFSTSIAYWDGLTSVQRGFKRKELLKLAPTAKIRWHWPFRYLITIES